MPVFHLKEPREDFCYWVNSELARSLEFVLIHRPWSCQQLIVHPAANKPPDPPHHSALRQCFSAKRGFTPTTDTWPCHGCCNLGRWRSYWCLGLPQWLSNKKPPAMQETPVRSLGQKIPWRRAWQPTPVFLPGESHGQRSFMGYSPQGHKELDMTEAT